MVNMGSKNQLLRFFFPLKITTFNDYEHYEIDPDSPPEEINSAVAVAYEDAVLAAITKENCTFSDDQGLALYLDNGPLKEKVHSLYPTVEIRDGELWGVMIASVTDTLSEAETDELIEFITGQNSDGWGEGFEQLPIQTPDGEIFVSFWNSASYFIKPEQELKQLAANKESMRPTSN